jgi:hypothetical protein
MIITIEDGVLRAIVEDTDEAPIVQEAIGAPVVRASSIEPITEGEYAGWWKVDFHHLAKATGDPKFAFCLPQPFISRKEAIAAEVAWLKTNFLGLSESKE